MTMDAIDYDIFGDDMQYVEIELDPGEAAIGEAGMMFYMQDGIAMDTVFGDGSDAQSGLLRRLVGAGKRLLTGESLFTTVYVNQAASKRRLAFAAPYPGKIIPVDLAQIGGGLVCQKDAFLCAARGVSLGLALQRRLGAGFFGGEGFILQKLEGDGLVFIHAGGSIAEKTLADGEVLRVDTGCVAAFQPTVDFDIEFVGNLRSALFGGEGLFFARLTGPGRVWLQSLPLSRLADRLIAAAPVTGRQAEEGSVLGGVGRVLRGDNR
ncbi:MAG: TIGR00266 family protein [Thiobacillaceae bacterium]